MRMAKGAAQTLQRRCSETVQGLGFWRLPAPGLPRPPPHLGQLRDDSWRFKTISDHMASKVKAEAAIIGQRRRPVGVEAGYPLENATTDSPTVTNARFESHETHDACAERRHRLEPSPRTVFVNSVWAGGQPLEAVWGNPLRAEGVSAATTTLTGCG